MTTPRLSAPPMEATYPWVEWANVRKYLDNAWDIENVPHHSLIGLTGSGKSFLARHGLLDMCPYDRVLIFDSKGDDSVISTSGKPIKRFPTRAWYHGMGRRKREPYRDWYRLVLSDNTDVGHDQAGEALESAYDEGDWILYVDEVWDMTNREKGVGYNVRPQLSKVYRKGRGRRVPIIGATQSPSWVPREFYDQASFAWIGRIRDEDRQKRLLEIGGLSKRELPIVGTLQRRQWLLSADNGEFFARTAVKKGGVS